jgi:hypothetical protein
MTFLRRFVTVALFGVAFSGARAQGPVIRADPRIELFSILYHLAGAPEYNFKKMPAYDATVDAYFASMREHPAVLATKRIRGYGVGYFHPMNLAVHLTPPPELAERRPLDQPGHHLGRRWPADSARPYLELVRAFYRDAKVAHFFANRPLADSAAAALRALVARDIDAKWLAEYVGHGSTIAFQIVPALLNGGAQYAVSYRAPDGVEDAYAVIGIYKTDGAGRARFDSEDADNIVHEFSHTFVRSHIETHLAALDSAARVLYPRVATKMRTAGYGESQALIHEQIVRAVVVRYLHAHRGPDAAAREAAAQMEAGFLLTNDLSALFAEYERSRATYKTLAELMPRIIAIFRDAASRA